MSDEGILDKARRIWTAGSSTKQSPQPTPVKSAPATMAGSVPGGNKIILRKKYTDYQTEAASRGDAKVLTFAEWVDKQAPGL